MLLKQYKNKSQCNDSTIALGFFVSIRFTSLQILSYNDTLPSARHPPSVRHHSLVSASSLAHRTHPLPPLQQTDASDRHNATLQHKLYRSAANDSCDRSRASKVENMLYVLHAIDVSVDIHIAVTCLDNASTLSCFR